MTQEKASQPHGGQAPELLAPAGNWECARAAVENGADAIYFGLQVGFNARARAANFSLESLPDLMAMLHQRGVLGYVTLNTLVFTDELRSMERSVRRIAECGVDAVLVQDLGAARMIRQICPGLTIHASTQMTMTCAESIEVAQELGIERVVLARELSIAEIRKIAQNTKMPLEVFVHGALCVAYSGQCLTSESLGGRSANRGQCAQACRLNYQLLCDDQPRDLGPVQYLLSPQDLAGFEMIPELIAAGVCSLKIEGRLKTPEYVANVVQHYRRGIDAAMRGQVVNWSAQDRRELELSFSRGFSPGWLQGNDHKRLVPGDSSSKRGVLIGRVMHLRGEQLSVELSGPLACGDGIVLDGNRVVGEEIGGRIYQIFVEGKSVPSATSGRVVLGLQRGVLRGAQVYPGQRLWLTDDPQLTRRLKESFSSPHPQRRLPITLSMRVRLGEPIGIEAVCPDGKRIALEHPHLPEVAQKHPFDQRMAEQQLSRLGGTAYVLERLELDVQGMPMVPMSVLGEIRKRLVGGLDEVRRALAARPMADEGVAERMISAAQLQTMRMAGTRQEDCVDSPSKAIASLNVNAESTDRSESREPTLHVLCRTLRQVEQAIGAGVTSVYADFHDLREYGSAVARCREAKVRIYLATLRIHKPGERGLFLALAKQQADGWLVRNLAALRFARENRIPTVADFSLNVTNPLSAEWLMGQGAARVTASYDLNRDQLMELVATMPPEWLEVVIHQHMPMFHMEHCVFCSVLSPGTNKSNCGRPCDRHEVKLQDRLEVQHVLHADIGCRNTLYNGIAQSGAETVPGLLSAGVHHLRMELLRDAPDDEVRRWIFLYQQLLAGKLDGKAVWTELKAQNRVGVTRGTMEHPRNPLAIL